jgi:hypothetical protein
VYYTAGTNLELVPGIFGSHPLYFPRCVAVSPPPTHPTSSCVYHSLLIYLFIFTHTKKLPLCVTHISGRNLEKQLKKSKKSNLNIFDLEKMGVKVPT